MKEIEHGFKLVEQEHENKKYVVLTYLLSGGVFCEGTDRVSVAKAMDHLKKTLNSEMVDFVWRIELKETEEDTTPDENVIAIINKQLNGGIDKKLEDYLKDIDNEGTEI